MHNSFNSANYSVEIIFNSDRVLASVVVIASASQSIVSVAL